ncbi:MAG TPA: hypothetical protein VKB58_17615 [Terriglobales bacterium]|nr:hypothetical protein [Terriglobales bacterium]
MALTAALSMHLYAQEQPSTDTSGASSSDAVLSRNMLVPLKVVREFFPAISRLQGGEENASAVGNPTATRTAVYTTKDASKRVVLSVEQYASLGDALTAYQEAVKRTQVPELTPIALSNVGQDVFAGIVTQGGDTHVTIKTLDGDLLVGATLSGFDASTDNIAKLANLTRKELAQAKGHEKSRRGG